MAVVLGTSSGFVTVAPTDDPAGTLPNTIDGPAMVTKHTSPAGATLITEVGWWRDSGTNAANWEIGLYSEAAGVADALLYVEPTNSTTATEWQRVSVSWAISPNTNYWLGLQMDAHTGSSTVDTEASGGAGRDVKAGQTTLTDPFAGGAVTAATGMAAIYALVAPSFVPAWASGANTVIHG